MEWKRISFSYGHIDGDNSNNELSNLRWLCPNCNSQTETFCGKNKEYKRKRSTLYQKTVTKTEKITYKNRCPRCKTGYKTKDADYCLDCYTQLRSMYIDGTDILKPSREALKALIRTESFESIGRQYGEVSGNSIKKWCRNYNLPDKKSEIKQYTDEEWELV